MPKINKGKTVVVILSADEVRAAIEHAAWCAAVDDDPAIVVKDAPIIVRDAADGGYRVQYNRAEPMTVIKFPDRGTCPGLAPRTADDSPRHVVKPPERAASVLEQMQNSPEWGDTPADSSRASATEVKE